jgi:hypothetical protein
VIGIRLEDLAEEDRKKIKGEVMMHELEESSAETLKKKLACFHKTRRWRQEGDNSKLFCSQSK